MILAHALLSRSRPLPLDDRLVRPMRTGDARVLGRVLLWLVPAVGVAIVLALWLAKHSGVLSDARAVPEPSVDAWAAGAALALVLACVGRIAAWALGEVVR